MRNTRMLHVERAMRGEGDSPNPSTSTVEQRVLRLERALREILELSDGSAPALQRLVQVRRRAAAALTDLGG